VLAGLASAATAAGGPARCEWRAPARDPFRGDVPGAVDDYTDIPASTRQKLKARMARFAYDDIVTIRRDSIEGNQRYEPALLDMHFGNRRICAEVTRQSWRPDHEERGMAYCEDGHCIVVPLVCRNVSRIRRQPPQVMSGAPSSGQPTHPLTFDAPAAGLQALPPSPENGVSPPRTPLAALPVAPKPSASPAPPTPVPPLPPAADSPAPPAPPLIEPEPSPAPLPLPGMPPLLPLPPTPAVPEPATCLLWGLGLLALRVAVSTRRIRIDG
jgi:hypothetical protein